MSLAGLPYIYGKASPLEGFDCSGLARLLLHAEGIAVPEWSAYQLWKFFSQAEHHSGTQPTLGALVFYADSTGVVDHVAICLDENHHIEAAGGDHTTVNLQAAIAKKAFVRVTPLRQDRVAVFLPSYPWAPLP